MLPEIAQLWTNIFAWLAPPWRTKIWRDMTIIWGIVTAGFLMGIAFIGAHADPLLKPYLSVPLLCSLSLALLSLATYRRADQLNRAAGVVSGPDAEPSDQSNGSDPGAATPNQSNGAGALVIIAGNRLIPLAWLIAVGAFVIYVFPDM